MKHNEDSRVKIPAILHLTRLGYRYLSLKDHHKIDVKTNIFQDIFLESIADINNDMNQQEAERFLQEVSFTLDNEDLGKAFYEKLIERSGNRLIDFENFENNQFHVVTELTYKNNDDEFRPDITLLINGMPLIFIEVKKPSNREGILAELKRIEDRSRNKAFRRFMNITQLMVFSNNMEYDDDSHQPVEGAFYASTSYSKPVFNYFREEETMDLATLLAPEDEGVEDFVLADTNYNVIKNSPEFLTNKAHYTPTNRICTSLFSKERLAFLLQYAIVYLLEKDAYGKIEPKQHVMRYPQLFATKAIEQKLNSGVRKGIIWHTQGSGKTALAYYSIRFLTDYFQEKGIVPKFYFIVDRLDLMEQAKSEFSSRGLYVHTIDSKAAFAEDIKSNLAVHNDSGKPEITVVNIQRFKDDPDVIRENSYDLNLQRIYFLDEVHRSFRPEGSFLANLEQSDQNAIKIGLTGTPLIGETLNSKMLFGDYIHKYYYNRSIADGYTLRLIREEISTSYKMELQKTLEELKILKSQENREYVYSHERFVAPMLEYIINDFENSRIALADNTIGGMVICDSAKQAQKMFEIFNKTYVDRSKENTVKETTSIAADQSGVYTTKRERERRVSTAQLILHNVGTKVERKDWVDDFKDGKIDILFVYNMLLTGFDARRLKKLYLGRVIRRHNLLQALTRVNRTYRDHRYGFVVDFADISSEFDATNQAYMKELQNELGDEVVHYSNLFKSKEEMLEDIEDIKDILFEYETENYEIFSQQISAIADRKKVQELKRALNNIRSLYNVIRLLGHNDLLSKIDFKEINVYYRTVSAHLDMLNLKEKVDNRDQATNILNVALEDILFMFTKLKEEELVLADELKEMLRKTREALGSNFDQKDPEFITLKDELERLFHKKKLTQVAQEEMKVNIRILNDIYERVRKLNTHNDRLRQKYKNDQKYARIHKRLMEHGGLTEKERRISVALLAVKTAADKVVMKNTRMMKNDSYFEGTMMPLVIEEFAASQNISLDPDLSDFINQLVVKEYLNEFKGVFH